MFPANQCQGCVLPVPGISPVSPAVIRDLHAYKYIYHRLCLLFVDTFCFSRSEAAEALRPIFKIYLGERLYIHKRIAKVGPWTVVERESLDDIFTLLLSCVAGRPAGCGCRGVTPETGGS